MEEAGSARPPGALPPRASGRSAPDRSRRRRGGLAVLCGLGLAREALCFCSGGLWSGTWAHARPALRQGGAALRAAGTDTEAPAAAAPAKTGAATLTGDVNLNATLGPIEETGGGMFWINRPGHRSFEVRWLPGDTVFDLKVVIKKEMGVNIANQELQCNGRMMGPDKLLLDDWVTEYGGVMAAASGRGPDVWVFDGSDKYERDAAFPPIVYEEDLLPEKESERQFMTNLKIGVYAVSAFAAIYVFTQALGINPFEKRLDEYYWVADPATLQQLQQ